jgi:hypothetical protein
MTGDSGEGDLLILMPEPSGRGVERFIRRPSGGEGVEITKRLAPQAWSQRSPYVRILRTSAESVEKREPMMADTCVRCAAPLAKPATGRPPSYCSTTCRRAAEFELRRCERRLERLEAKASDLRIEGAAPSGHDWHGRRLARVFVEIKRYERRLEALLRRGATEEQL